MTENSNLVPVDEDVGALALSPTDSKHWELVQLVMSQFGPGCTTTKDALAKAEVPPNTYYRAMRNPIVQQLRLQQMMNVETAVQYVIERNWMPVIGSMIRIAKAGDSRESVQAARLIKDIYKDIQDSLAREGSRDAGVQSEAARTIRQFLGGKKVVLRQKEVVREIEVEDDVISDGNYEVVDIG